MFVANREAEKGFIVAVSAPTAEDIAFDWWIVGVKVNATTPQDNNDTSTDATTIDSGASATTTEPVAESSATNMEESGEETSEEAAAPAVE